MTTSEADRPRPDASRTATVPRIAGAGQLAMRARVPRPAVQGLLALAAPVSAWVAFLAARRLTGRFWAALIAGAVYGFSPYEIGHTASGQANLAVIMLLPLTLYLALLWRDGKLGPPAFVGLMAII